MVNIQGLPTTQNNNNTTTVFYKTSRILVGILQAAQRVCTESRLGNVYRNTSMPDLLNAADIPLTEELEHE